MEKSLVKKWQSDIFLMGFQLVLLVPTLMFQLQIQEYLEKGTAYQTDIGMCGDYNSVIGMNKENSIKRFLKDKDAVKHFPSNGEGSHYQE